MRAGLALAILIGTTWTAFAGGGFDIVIPGRPGVPIIINGIDASYAVVEGEWGLGRGEQVQPTIYGGRYVDLGPGSVITIRAPVVCRATGVSKSSRGAAGRRLRRATINHGLRNRCRSRCSPRCPIIRRR